MSRSELVTSRLLASILAKNLHRYLQIVKFTVGLTYLCLEVSYIYITCCQISQDSIQRSTDSEVYCRSDIPVSRSELHLYNLLPD